MKAIGTLSITDQLALKPKGYFTIAPHQRGQLVSVHRPGQPVEQFLCVSPGAANQLRIQLSDMGLTGYIEGAE